MRRTGWCTQQMTPGRRAVVLALMLSLAPALTVSSVERCRDDATGDVDEASLLQVGAQIFQLAGAMAESETTGSLSSSLVGLDMYRLTMIPLLALTLVLAWLTRPQLRDEPDANSSKFRTFRLKYLSVWALAAGADWLQGPYVYALYEAYGYEPGVIAQLFVAGFGSSMVFGLFCGSIADTYGRKRCAVLYCILYIASCLTKHTNVFGLLMIGRITGGMATSLLYSTFECWMVAEHRRNSLDGALLKYMFGLMSFANYVVAIFAGIVAQVGADSFPLRNLTGFANLHYGGLITPFDMAIVLLACAIPLICLCWEENIGDERPGAGAGWQPFDLVSAIGSAIAALFSSWRVVITGVLVAAFEGSMFVFIFNWTPSVASDTNPPPLGLIFSSFMMACMCGASLWTLLCPTIASAKLLFAACGMGAMALVTVMRALHSPIRNGSLVIYCGFLVFEACCGMYFPACGSFKSQVVPEEVRAGVYNLYRAPLNAIVICVLLTNLSLTACFGVCSGLLAVAAVAVGPLMLVGKVQRYSELGVKHPNPECTPSLGGLRR